MEDEHFGGGTSKKAGPMKTFETRLMIKKLSGRWWILRNGVLYKYKNQQVYLISIIIRNTILIQYIKAKECLLTIQLENYKLRHKSAETDKPNAFDLVNPVNSFTFVLESEAEKNVSKIFTINSINILILLLRHGLMQFKKFYKNLQNLLQIFVLFK